ncbi:MAG: ankyrin repeat domain-containing protein [Candidatus Krumholzibacteria bacterium]|nr:ankyrin repeat domain-containing protein [Candidatus Krumholzibacteria bacterium]
MVPAWEDAVRRGDLERIDELIGTGVDINSLDAHSQTALMRAAVYGHTGVVRRLIEHGANLNVTAKYNLSALMLAIINDHVDIATLLVEAGADLHVRGTGAPGFYDKTAAELALDRGQVELADDIRNKQ